MKSPRVLMFFAPFVVAAGCTGEVDNCGSYGAPVPSPRIKNGIERDSQGSFVRLAWDPPTDQLATLPKRYYDEVRLGGVKDTAFGAVQVAEVRHTDVHEVTVRFADAKKLAWVTVEVSIEFPDVREFTDCEHPGMPDRQFVVLSLTLDPDGVLTASSVHAQVDRGAI